MVGRWFTHGRGIFYGILENLKFVMAEHKIGSISSETHLFDLESSNFTAGCIQLYPLPKNFSGRKFRSRVCLESNR